jgi:hypothetical protein
MKAMNKTLLAASMFAAATGANAATVATYNVAVTPIDIIYHYPPQCTTDKLPASAACTPAHDGDILNAAASGGSGTAVLDDAGTLTMTLLTNTVSILGTNSTIGQTVKFTGAWNGTTFTAASGTGTYTSCVDNAALITCDKIALAYGFPIPFAAASGSATTASGLFNTTASSNTSNQHTSYALTAVPVPAAAWLFGSGLLGLAGTARRRRAV